MCKLNYPEVIRIDVDFLRVQHTQFSIGSFDVVHVLHSFVQAVQDNSTMSSNIWVSQDGSGVVQVSKVTKVPLSPGVDDKTSTRQKHFIRLQVLKL